MSLNTFFVKWAEHHFFTLLKLKEHVFSVDMNYEKSWNFNRIKTSFSLDYFFKSLKKLLEALIKSILRRMFNFTTF